MPGERESIAFPGQGVDPRDLARVLHAGAAHPLVATLASRLGTDDWDGLDLLDTRVAQPAVYTAGLVQVALEDVPRPGEPGAPVAAFGHSLGELAALAFAGAFGAEAGLDLVIRRAAIGHAVQAQRPGRMLVVMRLDGPQVEWVRRQVVARDAGALEVAVVNGPGQFVLSGDHEATAVAMELIAELGGVARPLTIGGAYHSPLMVPAVQPLIDAVAALELHDPAIPVVSCTAQTVVTSRDQIPVVLGRALVLPVRWVETLEAVAALDVDRAIDAGPSQTLANLARFAPVLTFRSLSPDPAR